MRSTCMQCLISSDRFPLTVASDEKLPAVRSDNPAATRGHGEIRDGSNASNERSGEKDLPKHMHAGSFMPFLFRAMTSTTCNLA
jgi:hypothetical protein